MGTGPYREAWRSLPSPLGKVAARRADGRGAFRRKLVGSTDKCGTDENRSPLGAPLPPPGGGTLPKGEGKCLPLWGRWQPEGLTDEVSSAGSLSAPTTNVAPTKTEAPSGHLSRPLAGAPSPKGRASAFPSGEGGTAQAVTEEVFYSPKAPKFSILNFVRLCFYEYARPEASV